MKYPRKSGYYWRIDESKCDLVKISFMNRKPIIIPFGSGWSILTDWRNYDWIYIPEPASNYIITDYGVMVDKRNQTISLASIQCEDKELKRRLVSHLQTF